MTVHVKGVTYCVNPQITTVSADCVQQRVFASFSSLSHHFHHQLCFQTQQTDVFSDKHTVLDLTSTKHQTGKVSRLTEARAKRGLHSPGGQKHHFK